MIRVALAVARRPSLWGVAIRQARRTARAGWWLRPPFVPVPDQSYMRFRLLTQYGETSHPPEPSDVLDYLAWCKRWDQHGRSMSVPSPAGSTSSGPSMNAVGSGR